MASSRIRSKLLYIIEDSSSSGSEDDSEQNTKVLLSNEGMRSRPILLRKSEHSFTNGWALKHATRGFQPLHYVHTYNSTSVS
jgi:hypothetical protein